MFCRKCGKELIEGATFCSSCGCQVDETEKSLSDARNITEIPANHQKQETDDAEDQSCIKKKKNPLLFIIAGIVVVFLLLVLIAGMVVYSSPKRKFERQLSLGARYLEELEYEKAIAAYRTAIDIEPNNPDTYKTLADIYIAMDNYDEALKVLQQGIELTDDEGLIRCYVDYCMESAELCADKEDYETAISILNDGINLTGSDRLRSKKSEYEEVLKRLEEEKIRQEKINEAIESIQPVMETITEMASNDDWDGIFAFMQTDEYDNFIETQKIVDQWVFDTSHGKIGLYEINDANYGSYMLYYGDYDEELREGEGTWFGYYEGNNYHAHGTWESDKPSGYWEVVEWNTKLDDSVVYRRIDGNVIDGLWDGVVNWNFETDEELSENPVLFENGKWVVTGGPYEDGDYNSSANYDDGGIYLEEADLEEIRGIVGYGF